ncbi:MAG: YihY/virulence factor BrkB family protein [Marmoricola sp.]
MTAPDLLERRVPGARAGAPTEIPRGGWFQVAKRAWTESQDHQVSLIAAGVAFYAFLSLFPAAIAGLMLYGLARNPADARVQAAQWTKNLPADAASVVTKQIEQLTTTSHSSLGIGLVVALVLALWSAAGGVGNLITALNIAYDEEETRGFVRRKALALGLTLAAIIFAVLALALVAAAPAVLDHVVGSGPARWGLEVARWLLLVLAMAVGVGVLYRVAPDRADARFSWVSVGAVTATGGWIVASVAFSVYVDHFGSYAKTYGTAAGVVVLLLWLWMTIYLVLLGAELNAAAEEHTVRDTTTGDPEPMGRRRAVKADTFPVGPEGES